MVKSVFSDGQSFAFLAVRGSFDLTRSHTLPNGVIVTTQLPIALSQLWRERLGSFVTEEIEDANLFISATVPGELGHGPERQDLKNRVERVWDAFLLLGIPVLDQVHMLGGAPLAEEGVLLDFQTKQRPFVVAQSTYYRFADSDIQVIGALASRLDQIVLDTQRYGRLRRGIEAYLKATSEPDAHFRLPQIVRAIEALILPSRETRKDFVCRGQVMTGAKEANRRILGEIYDLRSKLEHLHSWESVYQNLEVEQRETLATHRLRQAESLARHAFVHVLLRPELITIFDSDKDTERFWGERDTEDPSDRYKLQRTIWGGTFDLAGLP